MRSTATAEGKARRRRHAVGAAVGALGVALGVALAIGAGACGGSSPAPAATVTVTVAPSASPSVSPSPGSSAGAAPAQLVVAVASGAHANGISVISATGSVKQIVTPSGGPISDLSWAPDGVRLAFLRAVSDTNSTSSLFVYNARSALLYQVGAGVAPATIDSYAWAGPTRLIESYFPLGATTYHANGTLYLRDITRSTGQPLKDSGGHIITGVGVSASADAGHVAFVTYGAKSSSQIAESLHLYDAGTSGVSTVATGEAPTEADGDQFTYPSISPGGTLVATQQTGSDIGFGITVYGIDGTKHLQSGALVWPAPVSWTPHGPRLALGGGPGSSSGEHDSLLVWPAGAAKATPIITGVKRPITSLAWTPKGSQIAYAVAQSSGLQSSLWIVNANGSNRHLLLSGGSWPAWAVAPIRFP